MAEQPAKSGSSTTAPRPIFHVTFSLLPKPPRRGEPGYEEVSVDTSDGRLSDYRAHLPPGKFVDLLMREYRPRASRNPLAYFVEFTDAQGATWYAAEGGQLSSSRPLPLHVDERRQGLVWVEERVG